MPRRNVNAGGKYRGHKKAGPHSVRRHSHSQKKRQRKRIAGLASR